MSIFLQFTMSPVKNATGTQPMAFFYWTQMNLANLALTTHIRTQNLRNADRTVCLQVVL